MKAQELRIGNKIHWKSRKTDATINDRKDFNIVFESLEKYEDEFEPIPLTEEWLVKLGFENPPMKDYFTLYLSDKDENEFGRQRIDYWFGEDDFSAAELCRAGICFKRVKVKYVHQLQNLYFALTGTELTIQP